MCAHRPTTSPTWPSVFGRQESAPTDVSGVIGAIYDRMNEDLDDVLRLEINYVGGVIHRYVGMW